ncbi:MAG: GNAT family N-acetyltransferase [Kofleriaceae bacterium]|nr:GNAT family N-acetyltransferase [Myxococcales bacterium]MCB9562793.1 GNAT family N-acetyltransferase [Kofleriaceae bacterium]MCB9571112.1 GNAT family N-acetyltransferase [Kofleriaceae bacterium]
MPGLRTERLELSPVSLELVEAIFAGDRGAAERACGAALPEAWPGEELIARAFHPSLAAIRADPARRLWGDTLLILPGPARRVVGSVIFHGRPDHDGVAEVGYGVEDASQGLGYATEGTAACVRWALAQPGVDAVTATTFPWHHQSLRVIEKLGMSRVGVREHDTLGELWIYELRRGR